MILTDISNAIKNCGRKFRFINTLSFIPINYAHYLRILLHHFSVFFVAFFPHEQDDFFAVTLSLVTFDPHHRQAYFYLSRYEYRLRVTPKTMVFLPEQRLKLVRCSYKRLHFESTKLFAENVK